MSQMIVPTAADVIRVVRETMETVIAPVLPGTAERSAATTIGHLLRFVEKRIEAEGQILFDEANHLRALLPEAIGFLEKRPASQGLAAAIRETLAIARPPDIYPSLTLLAAEVGGLRQHVCDVLATLQALPPEERDAAGDGLHQKLRHYISWQIEEEGKIVEPAFVGRGARR